MHVCNTQGRHVALLPLMADIAWQSPSTMLEARWISVLKVDIVRSALVALYALVSYAEVSRIRVSAEG